MRDYSGSIIAIFISIIFTLVFFIIINPKIEIMKEKAIEYNEEVLNILND